MKLWSKNNISEKTISEKTISEAIQNFTVGQDLQFDLELASYDILATKAHAEMLAQVGLITSDEFKQIAKELDIMLLESQSGNFRIENETEDVHSQIELNLTQKLGEAGKKVHTGRSRNDQVLVAIKLFIKHEIFSIVYECKNLFETLLNLSHKHHKTLLPGYTHFQVAMPSSFGLWFSAYAESLIDDLEILKGAFNIANKNPLGSGAGYGTSFPLNRELTTELLGMKTLNVNSVYAQMTRGKSEKALLNAVSAVAATLAKLSYDVCLFMCQNFSFISFPTDFTTGSSIMPHKNNPDVFELIRAKCNLIQSKPNEISLLINNLPSGYHRDFQLTKEVTFPAVKTIKECLKMAYFMLQNIEVKENILNDTKYKYIFSVEEVSKKVMSGVSFREAYLQVGQAIQNDTYQYENKINHTHIGSISNLGLDKMKSEFNKIYESFFE